MRIERLERRRGRRLVLDTPGGGSPWIYYRIGGERSSIMQWGDGTITRYLDFKKCLDGKGLDDRITKLFHDAAPRMTSRSVYFGGAGVSGSLVNVPPDVAMAARSIVVSMFKQALGRMKALPDSMYTGWGVNA